MASRRNFIVVSATRGLALQALLALHALSSVNCAVVCAAGTRFLRYSWLISEYREADFSGEDDEGFVKAVNVLAADMPDVLLIPTDCEGARMIGRVRHRLRTRIAHAPDSSMLDRLDNKWHFYRLCQEHGLTTPPSRFIGEKHQLEFSATAFELGIPFIVKPVSEAGSKGVTLIASEDDFRRKILHDDSYTYRPLIAQRYVRGTDVGLNLLAVGGEVKAIAIQRRRPPQDESAKIDFLHNDDLIAAAHVVAKTTAYDGVMNVDARIEDGTGKVFLLECNPRFWRSLLASAWCGMNFVGEMIDPPPEAEGIRTLTSGTADTFWHPLFRPSLLRYAIFDRAHRGRMVRAMMGDICLLGSSVVFKVGVNRLPPVGSSIAENAAA